MESKINSEFNYVCVNCGSNVKELHKKYSTSVLKIISFEHCRQTAGKYIEFEPVIILIDLVLLSRPAYKHVLYNTHFKIYSKILVVQLLFEAYKMWKEGPRKANNSEYEAEKEFYFSFVLTVIEKSLTTHLVKAITLANIAKFFMIPIVIWGNNSTKMASLRLVLVNCYYFLSLVHFIAVLVNCSRKHAAVMTLVMIITKYIVMVEVAQRLKPFVMV